MEERKEKPDHLAGPIPSSYQAGSFANEHYRRLLGSVKPAEKASNRFVFLRRHGRTIQLEFSVEQQLPALDLIGHVELAEFGLELRCFRNFIDSEPVRQLDPNRFRVGRSIDHVRIKPWPVSERKPVKPADYCRFKDHQPLLHKLGV